MNKPQSEPVQVGEEIIAVIKGKPVKVRAYLIDGPTGYVHWHNADRSILGHMEYTKWQRARDAQRAVEAHQIAQAQKPPDDFHSPDSLDVAIDEIRRLRDVLTQVGNLTKSARAAQVSSAYVASRHIHNATTDLLAIRELVSQTLKQEFPETRL